MVCSIRTEVLFVSLLLAGLSGAAPSTETAARAAATEAKKAFDLGEFSRAIEQYEAAYKLKPAPGLLFNLGQSHRRAGNLEKASFYFRRYLESNPPEAQAKATEEVLAQVEAQKLSLRAAQDEQDRKDAERRALEEQRRHSSEEQQRLLELEKTRLAVVNAQERQFSLEAALKQEPPAPPVYQRWWFWGAIGVVVIGGAVTATAVATAPHPTPTTFQDINAR